MRKILVIILPVFFMIALATPVQAITQDKINAEVQIVCPGQNGIWFSGSGTIIDSKGIILTNKHVVSDKDGSIIQTCFIGFVESINREPNFGTKENPNLAEVKYFTTSSDMDAAILYLNNPANIVYPFINIWNSNSDALKFGDKLEVIGFPSIGGSTITYTSGDFSGFGSRLDGTQNYIKTTAVLEHGNSGGSAYNLNGQFAGIPSMVVTGPLNSISYALSVNSIKNWLSGLLGNQYKQEIINQKPVIERPTISIQDDTAPPHYDRQEVGLYQYDSENNLQNYSSIESTAAIYEFPRVTFGWDQDCFGETKKEQLDVCVRDNEGAVVGYYYYFGPNPKATPKIDGNYISADLLSKDTQFKLPNSVKLPVIFNAQKGINYFILQAKDVNNNVSNTLINLEYLYEPNKFKDIQTIGVKDYNNKLIHTIKYPEPKDIPICGTMDCKNRLDFEYIIKEVYTNQNTLYLYPKYRESLDGLVYYMSYGDDVFWHDKLRTGIVTQGKYLKVVNIAKNKEINLFIKPGKESQNYFFGKHYVLKIRYKANLKEKLKAVTNQEYFNADKIKYKNLYNDLNPDLNNFESSGIKNWGELKILK